MDIHGYYDKKEFYIDVLCVKAEYQHEGIGTELIKYVIDKAKTQKCTNLVLSVNPKNERAINFYEKIGMNVSSIKYNLKIN